MREVASYILYFVQNSVKTGASRILLEISEDLASDSMTTRVADNGRGLTAEMLRRILDSFHIKVETGRIGVGLSFVTTETRYGNLKIEAGAGHGTTIEAVWAHRRLNCPPRGDIAATVKTLIINNPARDIVYSHTVNGNSFWVATNLITAILAGEPLSHPAVGLWLGDYLTANINRLYAE